MNKRRDEDIQEMLNTCLKFVKTTSTLEFLESLNDFYERRGFLTDKQYSALEKIHDEL